MECDRIQDLLSDFIEGSIPEEEHAGIAVHLRGCRICANAAEGLETTIGMLRNLPPEKAPPELLEKIMMETVRQAPANADWWKKFFLPAHIKIPIEAAAAILLFLLVYGIQQKEKPQHPPVPPASRVESPVAASKTAGPAKKDAATPAAPSRADKAPSPKLPKPSPEPGERVATRESLERSAAPAAAPPPERAPAQPSELQAVAAKRISTLAERIEPSYPPGDSAGKETPIRMFAAPPPRLMQPSPYGRDVTLEVAEENMLGLEERIVEAAVRLGGNRDRGLEPGSIAAAGSPGAVRVRLPAESAERFLADLRSFGTIPAEGASAWADIPAGPAPGYVLYTVQIRIR